MWAGSASQNVAETDPEGHLGGWGKVMRLRLLGPQSWTRDAHGSRENFVVRALPAPPQALPKWVFGKLAGVPESYLPCLVALGWGGAT